MKTFEVKLTAREIDFIFNVLIESFRSTNPENLVVDVTGRVFNKVSDEELWSKSFDHGYYIDDALEELFLLENKFKPYIEQIKKDNKNDN